MCSTSIFSWIITDLDLLFYDIFLSIAYLSSYFSLQTQQIFTFSYDFCCLFVNNLIFFCSRLIIFSVCSRQYSQNLLRQFLSLYTSFLLPMFLNDDILDIQKPDRICSPTFAVDEFSGSFLQPSIFSIKHSRST